MTNCTKAANEEFKKGNYLNALSLYKLAILKTPKLESTLSLNITNCYRQLKLNPIGISNKIIQQNQIKQLSKTIWQCTESDPYFTLKLENNINSRFVLLSGIIETTNEINEGHIYIDEGSGFSTRNLKTINYKSNTYFEKTIEINSNSNHIRFDPISHNDTIKISALTARFLTEDEVKFRLEKIQETITSEIHRKSSKDFLEINLANLEYKLHNLPKIRYRLLRYSNIPHTKTTKPEPQLQTSIIALTSEKTYYQTLKTAQNGAHLFKNIYILQNHTQENSETLAENIHIINISTSNPAWVAINEIIKTDDSTHFIHLNKNYISSIKNLIKISQVASTRKFTDIIYCDEDQKEDGVYENPFFKPDWNYELATAQDYISGLCTITRSALLKFNYLKKSEYGFEIFQFILSNSTKDKLSIHHTPEILTHKAQITSSNEEKNHLAKSITESLRKCKGFKYVELSGLNNIARVVWGTPNPQPLVNIIIPTKDKLELIKCAVESILKLTSYSNYEITIINNQSTEKPTLQWLKQIKQHPKIKVLNYDKPFNYSAINNYAVSKSNGELIALLNNDIEIINQNWLEEMVSIAIRDNIGCVGAKLLYSNNTIQHAGVITGLGGLAGHSHKLHLVSSNGVNNRLLCRQNYRAVTGACLVVKREIYKAAKGLNEKDLAIAFNDVDFCLKVEALGYKNVWTPFAEIYHYESLTRGSDDTPEKQARFQSESNYLKHRWNTDKNTDHYYHKYFTQKDESFSLLKIN